MDLDKVDKESLDLSVKNPNIVEKIDERTPEQIISEIEELGKKNSDILKIHQKLVLKS